MPGDFFEKRVANPSVFMENRLHPHAEFETFIDGKTNRILSLDGEWSFSYADSPAGATDGFWTEDFDHSAWDAIQVPGHIQLQGYDKPHYTNIAYPWDGVEALGRGWTPEEFNPVAEYIKTFEINKKLVGQTMRLSFQGVESCAGVWLNGEYVGYFENSFDPAEFDITKFIKRGKNKLAVRVYKWCAGSWCEDQDFFRFSGIYRSVYIYTVPDVHMEDIRIRAIPDEAFKDGTLEVKVSVSNPGSVRFLLTEPSETEEDEDKVVYDSGEHPVGQEPGKADLYTMKISSPKLWSAEKPNLYKLGVFVKDPSGKKEEYSSFNVGFRKFELKGGLMLLNGKRIVFKGVNRHEFSSDKGRRVSDEELLTDILTMKKNNINAIRTSHYPDDVRIYDLCDKYGLYMIAENNMETHGTWQMYDPIAQPDCKGPLDFENINTHAAQVIDKVIPGDDERWAPMLLDRVSSCYHRDKNHPSILIWSIGNESFGGSVLQSMTDLFHALDPDRLVHYEGIFHDRRYPNTSDIESQMYPSVEDIEAFLAEHKEKPFICCEYTHAMGNSCGGMHKYTDLAEREPRYQGGFIWDYIDQSLDAETAYGEPYQAYGGDFGDRPSSYEFSGNGIVYASDRTPSPKMQEVKANYQGIHVEFFDEGLRRGKKPLLPGMMRIVNNNLFTSTSEYMCRVDLLFEGERIDMEVIDTDVAPMSEKVMKIPFYGDEKKAGEYAFIISFMEKQDRPWCKAGYVAAFSQWCYTVEYDIAEEEEEVTDETVPDTVFGIEKAGSLEIIRGEENIGVRGSGFSILFSGPMGGLVSYNCRGRELIGCVPKPNFWRAPTDNDRGAFSQMRYAQWKTASLYHRPIYAGQERVIYPWMVDYEKNYGIGAKKRSDGTFFIRYAYIIATVPETKVDVSYTVYQDGRIKMELDYDPSKKMTEMPEFGLMFTLDAAFDRLEWYGLGPEETYADRKRGGRLGIWKNMVKDNMARYLVPQECGNKEDVRYIKVMDKNGYGLVFTACEGSMSASALPYTPHQLETASHLYELPKACNTIVRLSKAQMGVGGDDSWGARVHPEYLLDVSGHMHFEVMIGGL